MSTRSRLPGNPAVAVWRVHRYSERGEVLGSGIAVVDQLNAAGVRCCIGDETEVTEFGNRVGATILNTLDPPASGIYKPEACYTQ